MNLWNDTPAATARVVQALCPDAARRAIARAGEICEHTFVFQDHWEMERTQKPVHFDGPVDWGAVPFGDPEWTYALNRHTIFWNLAKAWRYTGDARYLAAFEDLMADWLDRVPHTAASESSTWRSLEAGIRAEFWMRALELFGDAVSEPLLCRIEQSLHEHGTYLETAYSAFHALSNWGVIQDHGLFLLGIRLNKPCWQMLALKRMTENLHHAVLADGVHWEQSPMYHCEVLHAAADTLLAARRFGVAVPPELEQLTHSMAAALSVLVMPDRHILPQSDSDRIDAGDLLAQCALLFHDPALAAAAQGPLCEETLWDFGPQGAELLRALPACRPASPSAVLAVSGNPVLRSGWGPTDTCLHLHTGSLGGGHGHADLLHLDVWHGGDLVLTDSGRCTYVDGKTRRALKSPAAHNTLRLDGQDFTTYLDTWGWQDPAPPLAQSHRFTETADFVSGGHLGYLKGGAAVFRRVVFLKPELVVGVDVVQAAQDAEHTAEQWFHFGSGTLRVNGCTARWQGRRTKAQLHWFGSAARASESPRSPEYNTLYHAPALCLTSETKGTTALPFVLSLGGKCTAALLPVTTAAGQPLCAADAQALSIQTETKRYTIIFSHRTGPHNGALLCADGYAGRGNVLVFTPQTPQGLCLD